MTWTHHDHDPEMPNLVDDNPYPNPSATFIHPPQNASYGGQPDLHAAFPGYTNSPWSAPASTPYPTYTQLQHNPYNYNTPGQSPYTPVSSSSWGAPLSVSGYPSYSSYPYANTPNSYSHSQPQIAFYPPASSPFGQPLTANSYFNTQPQPQIQMVRSRSRANSFSGPLSRPGSLRRSSSFGGGSVSYYAPGYGPGYAPGPGYAGPRGYTRTESYHSENLARRPREWRADFTMSSGISAYVPRLSKSRSTVQEIIDPTRRDLHPYLQYQNPLIILSPTQGPPISWDLRFPPFPNPHSPYSNANSPNYPNSSTNYPAIHLTHPNRPPTPLDYAQLTTHPPTSFMRLYHPRLPWYIDIVPSASLPNANVPYHPNASGLTSPYHPNASGDGTTFHDPNSNGITFYDLVTQLHAALHRPISGKDFWNEEVGWVERERVTRAFWERCALVGGAAYGSGVGYGAAGGGGYGGVGGGYGGGGLGGGEVDAGEVASGIRRIDFLRRSVVFLGLSRGRNGMWEIKTEKVG